MCICTHIFLLFKKHAPLVEDGINCGAKVKQKKEKGNFFFVASLPQSLKRKPHLGGACTPAARRGHRFFQCGGLPLPRPCCC